MTGAAGSAGSDAGVRATGGCEAATLAYSQDNEISDSVSLADGFFDCGHGWGATIPWIGAAAMLQMLQREGATRGREVLLVDGTSDRELKVFAARVVRELGGLAMQRGMTAMKLARCLVRRVSDRLGGYGAAAEARLSVSCTADIQSIRQRGQKSDVIPLGEVKLGVCRHRSIMFKYIADLFTRQYFGAAPTQGFAPTLPSALHLRCKLLRGRFVNDRVIVGQLRSHRSVGHAWNQVFCPDVGAWFVVDVMHGRILLADSAEARRGYQPARIRSSAPDVSSPSARSWKSSEAPRKPLPVQPVESSAPSQLCRKHSVFGVPAREALFCGACFKLRCSARSAIVTRY